VKIKTPGLKEQLKSVLPVMQSYKTIKADETAAVQACHSSSAGFVGFVLRLWRQTAEPPRASESTWRILSSKRAISAKRR
jgi:hypothetical protein